MCQSMVVMCQQGSLAPPMHPPPSPLAPCCSGKSEYSGMVLLLNLILNILSSFGISLVHEL